MSPSTITLLFLLFAVVMFVLEKIPLGVTSMIVCCGLVVTGVLDVLSFDLNEVLLETEQGMLMVKGTDLLTAM